MSQQIAAKTGLANLDDLLRKQLKARKKFLHGIATSIRQCLPVQITVPRYVIPRLHDEASSTS